MYDNLSKQSIVPDVLQYAQRLAECTRTADININQQKTPRFWKCRNENKKSVRDIINNVDSYAETVLTYKMIDLDDIDLVLNPAPYVTDKIDEHKNQIWNEFLRLIGVANSNYQKRERNITDEVNYAQRRNYR